MEVLSLFFGLILPPKKYVEPENHLIKDKQASSKPSFLGSMLIFRGVLLMLQKFRKQRHHVELAIVNIPMIPVKCDGSRPQNILAMS